ncbi:MAG: hypothetical protein QW196_06855, partial [Sulfolobales archaeon]
TFIRIYGVISKFKSVGMERYSTNLRKGACKPDPVAIKTFYGILEAMRKARELLVDLPGNISRIIVLGIQYMNLPLIYRVHG